MSIASDALLKDVAERLKAQELLVSRLQSEVDAAKNQLVALALQVQARSTLKARPRPQEI